MPATPAVVPADFDRVVDRRCPPCDDSVKWNRYAGSDILPLWVADMDFAVPPAVVAALQQRVAHGVFGYAEPRAALVDAACAWAEARYGWRIEPEWLVWLPGLVTGLNVACRAVPGDVVTATPVYPPFMSAPRLSGNGLATFPLHEVDGRWTFDLAAAEAALTAESRLFLLCHPHNPVGRAWEKAELEAVLAFCRRHDLVICSDEIHCDLILDGRPHLPAAMLAPDLPSITLMAPSKTFNVPGLGCAYAVIADAALRRAFTRAMAGIVPHVNVLGLAACEAALSAGGEWHEALLQVLRRNRDRVEAVVAETPGITMHHVEATYLAWIDVRGLALSQPQRHFEACGVGLSDGADFGTPGWLRLNFGCPWATLEAALQRLRQGALSAGAESGSR